MTPKKSLEDILAEYTEDLIADREPRLAEDIAALDEDERSQLMAILVLVRQLKAAHRKPPLPREDFLRRLDTFVREEINQQAAPESWLGQTRPGSLGEVRAGVAGVSLHHRILKAGRELLSGMAVPGIGRGWRFVGVGAVVIVLGLQVQLYLQVRRLEQQNQALVARLEQSSLSGGLIPLELPRGQQTIPGKDVPTARAPYIDDLLTRVELRVRVEQRVRELEREAGTKAGREREIAEGVVRELRGILQAPQAP